MLTVVVANMWQLKTLDLSANAIQDEGATHVAKLLAKGPPVCRHPLLVVTCLYYTLYMLFL